MIQSQLLRNIFAKQSSYFAMNFGLCRLKQLFDYAIFSKNCLLVFCYIIILGHKELEYQFRICQQQMSNSLIQSSSDENDNQVLLPISSLSPPNEIIKRNYSPDVKPTFRLINPEKKKKVTLFNEGKNQYADNFTQNDTLGYQYASRLRNNLVYLKFNNINYLKLQIKGLDYNLLSGMFIPIEKLLDQGLKKTKNIYKHLQNIDYVDYKSPVDSSFGPNCYSVLPGLRFSSNYQSSNLFAAFHIGLNEYDLILQNDINAKGNTQWFNFTVQIAQEQSYRFNIVNLTKSTSLYQKGMSVALYSQANKLFNKVGWMRGCHNITYSKTRIKREGSEDFHYKLSFQYKSHFKNDIVTFAYCYPYGLIDLQKFFNRVVFKKMPGILKIEKVKIAETLSGFPVNAYTICYKKIINSKKCLTSSTQSFDGHNMSTPSVIFMARQHPGQSQGSYITQGIVEWLLSGDYDGWKKNFIFHIVPMINVDGVFYGNYRTNLSGNDLNRVWRQPRKDYHFQIYSLKKYFFSLNKTSPISLIIDIHGHSNSLNSFFYGNPAKKECEYPRHFPYYCSKKIKQVSYHQSTFTISEDKKSCARVVLSEMFPKALVYTFENSFYGWKRGRHIVEHTIESYKKLGRELVQCFIEYSRLCDKCPGIRQKWQKEIQQIQRQKYMKDQLQEIATDSEEQMQKQVIDFSQMQSIHESASLNRSLTNKQERDSKNSTMSKTRFIRYLKQHSPPAKLKIHYPNNETYITEKPPLISSQSQGFLSIIKIHTRSNIELSQPIEQRPIQVRKSVRYEQRKENIRDEIMQESGDEESNNLRNDKYIKVGRLINQKQLTMEKIKQKRIQIKLDLFQNKRTNGIIKYSTLQK